MKPNQCQENSTCLELTYYIETLGTGLEVIQNIVQQTPITENLTENADFKKHIDSVENKLRYRCLFCVASFSYKVNLSIHTKKFHKKKQRSKVLGVVEKNDLGLQKVIK